MHLDVGILLKRLCVVDVDNHTLALELEDRFPALKETACEDTVNGRHYYFERSALADAHGYFDGRAQVMAGVDFKTVCAPCPIKGIGTSGLIVTAPSQGKQWIRPPWELKGCYMPDHLPSIPDDILRAVATPCFQVAPDTVLLFTRDGSRLKVCNSTWLPRFAYLAPFFEDLSAPEVPVPMGSAELMQELLYICNHKGPSQWPLPDLTGLHRLADFLGAPNCIQELLVVGTMPPYHTCGRLQALADLSPEWAAACLAEGLIHVDLELRYTALKPDVGASSAARESWLFAGRDGVGLSEGDAVLQPVSNLPEEVLELLNMYPEHLMLAGGSALSAVCPHVAQGSDYDLFVYGVPASEAVHILKDVEDVLEPDLVTRTGTAVTMLVGKMVVQVVLWLFDSPEHVLQSFDIAASQVGLYYDKDGYLRVVAKPQWKYCMQHMTIVVDTRCWSAAAVPRVFKYYAKGFDVVLPGMPRWCLLPHAKQACTKRSRYHGITCLFQMEATVDKIMVCPSWVPRFIKQKRCLATRRPTFAELHRTLVKYNNWGVSKTSGYAEKLVPSAIHHVLEALVSSGMSWLGLVPAHYGRQAPPHEVGESDWRVPPQRGPLYPRNPCLWEAFARAEAGHINLCPLGL